MKRIARRIHTSGFKRQAIKLVTEQGLTLAEVCRKFLLVAIKAAHQRGRGTYGPKKIRDELVAQAWLLD